MSINDLILKRRTIRRFKQDPIDFEVLESLVNTARLAPSAMNSQPLEFVIVDDADLVDKVFSATYWARYLPDDTGRPGPDKKPVAFITVMINEDLESKWTPYDVGAAVENIILAALDKGIGTCWIGSLERESISELLNVGKGYKLDSVVALGYPAEEPKVVPFTDSPKYFKDDDDTLCVPKKDMQSICHRNSMK